MTSISIPSVPASIPTTNILPPVPVNTQSGTSYTFALVDAQAWTRFSNASGCIITLPANVFSVGTQLTAEANTVGQVQVIVASGVVILPKSPVTIAAQNGVIGFMQVATNIWVVYGLFQ